MDDGLDDGTMTQSGMYLYQGEIGEGEIGLSDDLI